MRAKFHVGKSAKPEFLNFGQNLLFCSNNKNPVTCCLSSKDQPFFFRSEYSKNPLIRNPGFRINLFCLLYKGAISRNSMKFLKSVHKKLFIKYFLFLCLSCSVTLHSISAVSRYNRQSSHHFLSTLSVCVPCYQ